MRLTLRLLAAAGLFALTSCNADRPGEGEKAAKAKAQAAEIISALESYKADQGAYPMRLEVLFPKYLPVMPAQIGRGDADDGITFGYGRTSPDRFQLEFNYFGPGSNTCMLDSASPQAEWECGGSW